MKSFYMFIGMTFCAISVFAAPISAIYGAYLWAIENWTFKEAVWETAKTWGYCCLGFIPAAIFINAA